MYRQASRSFLRSAQSSLRNAQPSTRRFINTAPPHEKSRSWKSSAARWGIAIAGVYYYNTHPMFADTAHKIVRFESPSTEEIEAALPTVDSYSASRKQQQQQEQSASTSLPPKSEGVTTDDPAALEEEAESQGAFNPATGEINWDCPCLGGMAHGPCGEDFRNAFSCFVYSEQEPKGLDCIEKFKSMQDCFREHPDVYAAELEEDEELDAELAQEREAIQKQAAAARAEGRSQGRLLEEPVGPLPVSPILSAEAPPARREPASKPAAPQTTSAAPSKPPQSLAQVSEPAAARDPTTDETTKGKVQSAKQDVASNAEKFDEGLELMPKAWHDGTAANEPSTGEHKSKE